MRFQSRTWFLLGLLFFVGSIFFWRLGNQKIEEQRRGYEKTHPTTNQAAGVTSALPFLSQEKSLLTIPGQGPAVAALSNNTAGSTTFSGNANPLVRADPAAPLRLRNTTSNIERLARTESAILLRNAFIDTSDSTDLAIPAHLRAENDPGSYIVQARGPATKSFRKQLRQAGAEIVSYIPNNAFLVRIKKQGADLLAASPQIQTVLPYQPYFKLDSSLLALAIAEKPLPPEDWLRVTLFPGEETAGRNAVAQLGGRVVQNDRTPFGPQLIVAPQSDSLPALARLGVVQEIEKFHSREMLDALQRVALGVSSDTTTNGSYLGLTGSNVVVNVNDSGVDPNNPILAGRVFVADPLEYNDYPGHGTHVLGILLGDDSRSLANVPGGTPDESLRGIAPAAKAFVLQFSSSPEVSAPVADSFVQEVAARTNEVVFKRTGLTLISNNSWAYRNDNDYDSAAARFDAAVRDALPDEPGYQPIAYVFAAGNSGVGGENGLNGDPNSILSPATAKNVITVGALENFRGLTNAYLTDTNGILVKDPQPDGTYTTNQPFLGSTDDPSQVAAFSSRGNVGIGTEGQFGRFKPDVVAPGTFVISSKSQFFTQNPLEPPEVNDLLVELNKELAPVFVFDSGTSMAAPAVSGVLALMQEFFEQRLDAPRRRTNSPALMKALLINGARSASPNYDFQVQNTINLQGWGLVNLSNSIPQQLLNPDEATWPIRFFDQNPTNALSTGQSRSWNVSLSDEAQLFPLRVTLVWTDPPGNPSAALKLVNDLDLMVSNVVTHEVFYGNNIPASSDFNDPTPEGTDGSQIRDIVNNVENVFIREPSSNLVVQVVGRRVNVNSVQNYFKVTQNPDDIVQDFALVVSSANTSLTNALTVADMKIDPPLPNPPALGMTNGVPLLHERVGAEPSLLPAPGFTNQWRFYVFTNVFDTNAPTGMTNGTNVAFVLFSPPNLSRPRNVDADLDLYVSNDPSLTNLNPVAIAESRKSLKRGGTESVVFANAAIGQTYYIGVKAEDQQGGEFGLIALSTNEPFDRNENGSRVLQGFPINAAIPDGTPQLPGAVQIFAVGVAPVTVQKVVVTNTIAHQNLGDLIGNLSHEGEFVVLNNHSLGNGTGTDTFVYDDSNFSPAAFSQPTDGPGSLKNFQGLEGSGVWILTMVDNSPSQTGLVQNLTIRVDPLRGGDLSLVGPNGIDGTVLPGEQLCYFLDVPAEATNLTIRLTRVTGALQVLMKRGQIPDGTNDVDKAALIVPPGGDISLGLGDNPPLQPGRYFICLFNPDTANPVNFHLQVLMEFGLATDHKLVLTSTNSVPLLDDAVTNSMFEVRADREIVDVNVGVRIDHPRAGDLALRLVSPQGTSILLAENRGGTNANVYGTGTGTNTIYTTFTDQTNRFRNLAPIKFAGVPYTNTLVVGGLTNSDVLADGFEYATNGIYAAGTTVSGWQVTSGQAIVHDADDALGIAAASGQKYLELDSQLAAATISTNISTPAGDYIVSFAYQRNPAGASGTSQALQVFAGGNLALTVPVAAFGWQSTSFVFRASSSSSALQFGSTNGAGPFLDSVEVMPFTPSTHAYVLPEESLTLLRGQRMMGEWKLEIADTRAGPDNTNAVLVAWELAIDFAPPVPPAITLTNGLAYSGVLTNSQTNYFIVDVCDDARAASVLLTGPSGRLQLLADRSGLPTGTATDDYVPLQNIFSVGDQGFADLFLRTNLPLQAPLRAGKRLFLAVHNLLLAETNNYDLRLDLIGGTCGVRPVIRLVDDVPYTNAIPPLADFYDYYVFTVSTNASSVKFELIPQGGDLGMVVKKGLPVPDQLLYDFKSDQAGDTNEVIVVSTNTTPVLTPGDWYISVWNNSTNLVPYTIRATETGGRVPTTNEIINPRITITDTNICLDWDAEPGVSYFVEARTNLVAAPWDTLAGPLVTTNSPILNFCIDRPTPYRFFQIRVDRSLPPPTNNVQIINPEVIITDENVCLLWNSIPGTTYFIDAKTNLLDLLWQQLDSLIASGTNAAYCVQRPTPYHFFRIRVDLGLTNVPPVTNAPVVIDPSLLITATNICFTWSSQPGGKYHLEAKTNIQDVIWTNLTGTLTASGTNQSFCVDLPTPYHFFRVKVESAGTNTPPTTNNPPSTNAPVVINPRVAVSSTNVCFTWSAQLGQKYHLDAKTNITDLGWTNVTGTLQASATNETVCIKFPTPYRFFRIALEEASSAPGTNNPPSGIVLRAPVFVSAGNLQISWTNAVAGQTYSLEFTTNLVPVVQWTTLTNVTAASSDVTINDRSATSGQRFYRVRVP